VTRGLITSVVTVGCLALVLAAEATAAPVPSFTVTPEPVVAGEEVTFRSDSAAGVGAIVNTEWDFDADGTFEESGPEVPHTFAEAGTFDVTLRVTDEDVPETSMAQLTQEIVVEEPPPPPPDPPLVAINPLPGPLYALEPVTFTSNITPGTGNIESTEWDFGDGNGDDVPNPTHTFASPGTYTVRLLVEDSEGLNAEAILNNVVVNPPRLLVPAFSVLPTTPTVDAPATFTSTTAPISGLFPISSIAWYVDGALVGNAPTATHTFSSPGNHSVTLVVDDARTLPPVESLPQTVYVNARPVAGFNAFPNSPVVGETVHLNSTSSDLEGEPSQQWDLDGDGAYDDGSGRSVTGMFRVAGHHTVSLHVTDSQNITDTASKVITVRPSQMLQPIPNQPSSGNTPSKGNPATTQQPFLRLLTPFPVVRLQGAVVKRGTRIRRLTVRAPKGSRVLVFCRGKRCPAKRLTKLANRGTLRFRALERLLPPRSLLQVFVRRGDQIGKYTSFLIRRKRVPKRIDGCLLPSSPRAVTCPEE
jgi:PKD repeat protein